MRTWATTFEYVLYGQGTHLVKSNTFDEVPTYTLFASRTSSVPRKANGGTLFESANRHKRSYPHTIDRYAPSNSESPIAYAPRDLVRYPAPGQWNDA